MAALASGSISLVSKTAAAIALACSAATGGTGPYTYQWYRSNTSGFTPGAGNILTGQTALSLVDTNLVPNTVYYYKVISTDSVSATVTSVGFAVTSEGQILNQNQFAQRSIVGMMDQKIGPTNVISCEVDASETTTLVVGQAVKIVDNADGAPKVVKCSANSDEVFGFIVFNQKDQSYVAGSKLEVAIKGSCMFLYAANAIARGAQVTLDLSSPGMVGAKNTSDKIVGYAFDKAAGYGSLIRVMIETPSFTVA